MDALDVMAALEMVAQVKTAGETHDIASKLMTAPEADRLAVARWLLSMRDDLKLTPEQFVEQATYIAKHKPYHIHDSGTLRVAVFGGQGGGTWKTVNLTDGVRNILKDKAINGTL